MEDVAFQVGAGGALALLILREVFRFLSDRNPPSVPGSLTTLGETVATLKVKVDTLWRIYAEDAIREARMGGLLERKSAERPTDKWDSIVSADLNGRIYEDISTLVKIHDPYDVAVHVWREHHETFVSIAEEHDLTHSQVLGVLVTIAMRARERAASFGGPVA